MAGQRLKGHVHLMGPRCFALERARANLLDAQKVERAKLKSVDPLLVPEIQRSCIIAETRLLLLRSSAHTKTKSSSCILDNSRIFSPVVFLLKSSSMKFVVTI